MKAAPPPVARDKSAITLLDIGMVDDGHRAPYVEFLSSLFHLERMGFCSRSVLSSRPVLVPMVEESFAIYVCTALIRSLTGKTTVGLLFRPRPALDAKSLRLRVKYWLLRALRHLPRVRTLTIVPFAVEPRFAEIAAGWIYDPQLWDLDDECCDRQHPVRDQMMSEVRNAAGERIVCVALGRQDADKGFDRFADIYTQNAGLRKAALFAFGGKVTAGLEERCAEFTAVGGFACDRFVSNEELLGFYAAADLVWCAYAPDYDQASGILGRAVQLGIPVIVRSGSLVDRFCKLEGIAHIANDGTGDWRQISSPPPREPCGGAIKRKRRMRAESLNRLRAALGEGIAA